jgi:pimeloyl-ACP methyl ester carboxylesterase
MTSSDQVAMTEQGSGAAVVLIHGFPGSAKDFGAVAQRLSTSRRVLVPDLLGFGASDCPSGSLWIDRQAMAIEAALEARGVREATLVGHDVGGPVAAWLATRWGRRTRGLVIASCSLVKDPPLPLPFRFLNVPVLGALLEAMLFSAPALRALARFSTRGVVPVANTRAEVTSIRRIFATALRDLAHHYGPLEERLSSLSMPSTFVVGAADPFFNGDFAKRMAGLLPGKRLELIEEAGHFPQLERPEAFAKIVEDIASAASS